MASFLRWGSADGTGGDRADDQGTAGPEGTWPTDGGVEAPVLAWVANLTAVVHRDYRIGLPRPGRWREVVSTDAEAWGGSGVGNGGGVDASGLGWHGRPYSAGLVLPPLSVWLAPE